MILVIHITVAIASLISSGLALWQPSENKLKITYALVAGMLGTGIYLIVSNPPAHMTQTCITGLAYLGLVGLALFRAKQKLKSV